VRPKLLDFVALAVAVGVIAAISVRVYGGGGRPVVEVRGAYSQEWVFPLDSEESLKVRGPLGDTEVVISGGAVRIVESPCPEKICIRTGAISRPGQTIACLPNQVIVVIRGESRAHPGEQVDAFSW
jgi:hypothetical protein